MQELVQFGPPEERLLLIIIESVNNAGFALALQAFATLLLGAWGTQAAQNACMGPRARRLNLSGAVRYRRAMSIWSMHNCMKWPVGLRPDGGGLHRGQGSRGPRVGLGSVSRWAGRTVGPDECRACTPSGMPAPYNLGS